MVDTGATQIVLSRSDAQRAGIEVADLAFLGTARTANGTVRTAPVWLQQLTIGPLSFDSIRAVVNEGALDTSLLGMSFLNQFDSIEIRDSELILRY
jgi:aspartyl protease family protein